MEKETKSIAAALLTKDNRALVIRRADQLFGDQYSIPGGKVECGETPREALKREIMEELGIGIRKVRFLNRQTLIIKNKQLHSINFTAEPTRGKIRKNNQEILSVKWIPIKKNLRATESVNELIALIERKRHETKKISKKRTAKKKAANKKNTFTPRRKSRICSWRRKRNPEQNKRIQSKF
jgi:mutator protein MutT